MQISQLSLSFAKNQMFVCMLLLVMEQSVHKVYVNYSRLWTLLAYFILENAQFRIETLMTHKLNNTVYATGQFKVMCNMHY